MLSGNFLVVMEYSGGLFFCLSSKINSVGVA